MPYRIDVERPKRRRRPQDFGSVDAKLPIAGRAPTHLSCLLWELGGPANETLVLGRSHRTVYAV